MAPAILAGGLLAGEMRGFEGSVPAVVRERVARVGFGPVVVRAPAHPDRLYEGSVPAPVRGVSRPRVVVAPAVPPVEDLAPGVEEPVTPAPVRTQPQVGCSGEWVDTWLWDLCREEGDGVGLRVGGSLVPGI